MARLILLNGAPGVGKSTVARRLVDVRPLALLLDLDVVRSWLGPSDDVTASYLAARGVSLAMASERLRSGHDVVVPQYLGRPEFVVELESLAGATGSTFVEIALTTSHELGRAHLLAARPAARRVDAGGELAATV